MANRKRTVLITGCSDGGMGAALAIEMHKAGFHVYATARDPSRMQSCKNLGIETLTLDIQSEDSLQNCVKNIPKLDILVNNAGATYIMPVADLSIRKAKELFELNLWGQIATTQAFLPLLLKSSNGIIVNHTSVAASIAVPFQAAYNASKSAFSIFSEAMRMELEPFNVHIVEMRTGTVKTKIVENMRQANQPQLPSGSIYSPAREDVEKALRVEYFDSVDITVEQWATSVVADLSKKTPPKIIWSGESAQLIWFASFFPSSWLHGSLKKMVGLDKVASEVAQARRTT